MSASDRSQNRSSDNPEEYVKENRETLVYVIKHGSEPFVRALAMAALVEYGGRPGREQLERELDQMERMEES